MKAIVQSLSALDDKARGEYVRRELDYLGLPVREQSFEHRGINHKNIIADIEGRNPDITVLVSSHFDTVRKSPGANDNASAVAVTLGIAEYFLQNQPSTNVRLAFFDAEELNVAGSRHYVATERARDINSVFNMELVGEGTIPVFWPSFGISAQYRKFLEECAGGAYFLPDVLGHSSDHQPFMDAGVQYSSCLTLAHEKDRKILEKATRILEKDDLTFIDGLRLGRMIRKSYTMRNYHKRTDVPRHINEESLELARSVVIRFVERYQTLESSKPSLVSPIL